MSKKIEIGKGDATHDISFHNAEHVPYNKHAYEVRKPTHSTLSVKDYNGRKPRANPDAWTTLTLTEVVTPDTSAGRTYERTISITLDPEARKALRDYLNASEAETWEEAISEADLVVAGESPAKLSQLLTKATRNGMTAEQAAKACYAVLQKVSAAAGQKPDLEVMIRKPGEDRHYNDARCWCVAWEAGPHDWAVHASMEITGTHRHLVEPYYGFDLMFYPSEWKA